jgi:hypothetical protein
MLLQFQKLKPQVCMNLGHKLWFLRKWETIGLDYTVVSHFLA